ncbi:MAG: 2-phospho-L-lactate transferase [Pseudomonadales bacterium]|nr:2-phospho-L-lactate transferase [Pseudomonadales bacterium]
MNKINTRAKAKTKTKMKKLRPNQKILALSGGVGGAKLALGLTQVLPPEQLSIVINSADDFEHLGLHISPDIDTHLYALSNRDNQQLGWGRRDETWSFMDSIGELNDEDWFQLGDRDLALHILRTQRLKQGQNLSGITHSFAESFGIKHALIPMSDDPVRTMIKTGSTEDQPKHEYMPFQRYFVQHQCQPVVTGFHFEGVETATASKQFMAHLADPALAAVIICPSNPYVSIDPILALPDVRIALIESPAKVIAISPIVGGAAIKGPAAKMMKELNVPVNPAAVAAHYGELLDGFVIDQLDSTHEKQISSTGLPVLVTDTMMIDIDIKQLLAQKIIDFALSLTSSND